MKNQILFIFILCVTLSCKETVEYKHAKNSVSFICPANWTITEEQEDEDEAYHVIIEKNEFGSSGLIILNYEKELYDLNEFIEFHINQIQKDKFKKKLEFDTIRDNKFNTINSKSTTVTFTSLDIEYEVEIHAFYNNDRSYIIEMQSALEDKTVSEVGFKRFKESFSIK